MVALKSEKDIEMLKCSGKILALIMHKLIGQVKTGVSTQEIDRLAEELILKEKALPAFKGYNGFPASICASVNEEVVHGIPGERRLKEGDIISLDLGVNYEGYFSDAAVTLAVGRINQTSQNLINVTKEALSLGIGQARQDNYLGDISNAIQGHVEKHGFSVVRQFVGHGIGNSLHEEPEIPNFGTASSGQRLKNGMVLAIEPMVNTGTWECDILDNGWTAVTKDRLPSAHFEHTVAITQNGPEILTA